MTLSPIPDYHRINGIVNFMREATAVINPEEALVKIGIDDIEKFSSSQLTHLFVREGVDNPNIKQLFKVLNPISTIDIRFLNADEETFKRFIFTVGGLYYAKSVRRLIKKTDIMDIKVFLSDDEYRFIFNFATNKACLADYPLIESFEAYFYAVGHHIYTVFMTRFDPLIIHYVSHKLDLPEPEAESEKSIKHLRISNEYALSLGMIAQHFIIKQME